MTPAPAFQLTLPVERHQPRPPRPAEPILRSATVDGLYRLTLERAWGAGPRLAIAGLNPSTADGTRDDPTIWRAMGFAFRLGFGSLVMLNQEPLITPMPAELVAWRKDRSPAAAAARIDNFRACGLACARANAWLAAWGNGADPEVLELWLAETRRIAGPRLQWSCLGTNADGSPRHLLSRGRNRIPDDARLEPWRPG